MLSLQMHAGDRRLACSELTGVMRSARTAQASRLCHVSRDQSRLFCHVTGSTRTLCHLSRDQGRLCCKRAH